MAQVKISALTAADPLTGIEEAPFVQGGATKKATAEQIRAYVASQPNVFTVTQRIEDAAPALQFSENDTVDQNWEFIGVAGALRLDELDDAFSNTGTHTTFTHGGGVQFGAPTGGDQGAGTVNATGLYENGTGVAKLSGGADANFTAMPQVGGDDLIKQAAVVAVSANAFVKADGSQPAWTAPTASTLEAASKLAVVVGSTIVEIASGTAVTLPALSAGTDYTIYASDAGALQAVDADSDAPSGERAVGGFHASAGASEIVASSLWDLNWRPSATSPRGMVLSLDNRIWVDIYLMDTQYGVNGYSRSGAQIADDGDRPVIPDAYGGNGTDTYTSMSWWVAVDLATASGKRLPIYSEFTAFAYGVTERQAVGSDPVTTQHQAGHRSACGVEQVTGVMYQWGADITGTTATGSGSWQDIAEGRGDVYTHSIRAPRFGANWNNGSNAGSRASRWNGAPDNSDSSVGARAVSDHLNLQART